MSNKNLSETKQLEELIEIKRSELNELFCEYGLNDFTLKKSKELDELIVKVQKSKLEEYIDNDIAI